MLSSSTAGRRPPSMSFATLRSTARQLENDIEAKLVALNRHGSTFGGAVTVGAEASTPTDALVTEAQGLLAQLTKCNDALAESLASGATDGASQHGHTVTRHRERLNDFAHEFAKTRANIRSQQDKAELLSSVQRDINSYRSTGNRGSRAQELFMKESDHISSSSRLADDAISIAISAKEALYAQRGLFTDISSRVINVGSRFPALNNMMQKINFRKRRDSLILGGVIALCVIFLMWYTFR